LNSVRLNRIQESFHALMSEIQEALAEQQFNQVEHNTLRILRLLSKVEEIQRDGLNDNRLIHKQLNDCRLQIQSCLADISAQLAGLHAIHGDMEAMIRERLAAVSFASWNKNHYLQYALSVLQSCRLDVLQDIESNMNQINAENAASVSSALSRVKHAANAASEDSLLQAKSEAIQLFADRVYDEMRTKGYNLSTPDSGETVTLEQAMQELEEMIGLREVKSKIRDICNWVEFNQLRKQKGFKQDPISLHMVFSGNPGTGKTTVARTVGRILKALGVLKKGHVVEVDRSALVAEYVGQTAVKTMKKISEAKDGILFIDEAYSLTRSLQQDFGLEAVDTLVKEMEDKRSSLVVILAGYPVEMKQFLKANPGIHSRFNNQIDYSDFTLVQMLSIVDYMLDKRQFRLTDQAREEVRLALRNEMEAHPTTHGNARLVRNMIEQMILKKASLVVEKGQTNLDLIDEHIAKDAVKRLTSRGWTDGTNLASKN
jgi:stage V sporulation protein K